MFTSAPGLIATIERMIEATPIVDPHTHLRAGRAAAPDLAALMSYHWVQTELLAVGMPRAHLDPSLPAVERVRRAVPYLRRMSNTAMAWCFRRILVDLYDFAEPEITEANCEALCATVAERGAEPDRAQRILRDRCNIRTVVTSLGNAAADPLDDPDDWYFMLDAHYLFCPGVATDLQPFFDGRTTKAPYYDAIAGAIGDRPDSPERLEQGLRDWLDRTVTGRVRFSNTFLPIEHRFVEPDRARVAAIASNAALGRPTTDDEIDELARFVAWTVLGWHDDHRKAFQIAVGAEYFICDGKSIPRFESTWTSEMARAFHRFGNVRFDLMMASDVLSHEVGVLARQFPNVYLGGYWWHNFFPSTIEKIFGLRLQVAPMAKFYAFLCDAYYAEWSYGKLQVVKKAVAASLARWVEAGFYREEELPGLLKQLLHDTPRELYDLHG